MLRGRKYFSNEEPTKVVPFDDDDEIHEIAIAQIHRRDIDQGLTSIENEVLPTATPANMAPTVVTAELASDHPIAIVVSDNSSRSNRGRRCCIIFGFGILFVLFCAFIIGIVASFMLKSSENDSSITVTTVEKALCDIARLYRSTSITMWRCYNNNIPRTDYCNWDGVVCQINHYSKKIEILSLTITGNRLYGALPSSIGSFSDLTLLDFHRNYIKGTIPTTFSLLQYNLSYIDFSNNYLTQSIPSFIGNFTKLTYLDFGDNSFQSTIPKQLQTLSLLQYLGLYDNSLIGTIPPTLLSQLSQQLQLLDFYKNKLTGTLPLALSLLSNLVYLDLSLNKFTKSIPSLIFTNFTNLHYLYIDHNQLSGNILNLPYEKLPNLLAFWMNYNNINSSIPSAINKMTKIISLKLNSNKFTGSVPSSLCTLNNLAYLDITNNKNLQCIPNCLTTVTKYDQQIPRCS